MHRSTQTWLSLPLLLAVGLAPMVLAGCQSKVLEEFEARYGGKTHRFTRAASMNQAEHHRWKALQTQLGKDAEHLVPLRMNGGALAASRGRINIGFAPGTTEQQREDLARELQVQKREPIPHIGETWTVGARLAQVLSALVSHPLVAFAEPELALALQPHSLPNDPFFARQWHLNSTGQEGAAVTADVNAPEAWDITRGSPDVIIAIIDDGVDLRHEDLDPCRVIKGPDVFGNDDDPSPNLFDSHGTSCAGVAAASSDNHVGTVGICPQCRVMAIRLFGSIESTGELDNVYGSFSFDSWVARAFMAATDAGAAVVSNSWGPMKEYGLHLVPSVVDAAIAHANTQGRNGLGSILVFAAANDASDMAYNGYASHPGVVTVAASNDHDKRSYYSNYGLEMDVSAPSNDYAQNGATTTGIWTTDITGNKGYNRGSTDEGDRRGNYTNSFGGTSSACPLVAGTLGLVLSANPGLTRQQAIGLLTSTAVKIDPEHGNYDAEGHSIFYGHGRIDAAAAVRAALQVRPQPSVGVPCTTGCGDLTCVQGDRFDNYCTRACTASTECPDGYACNPEARLCIRQSTCPTQVELCGDDVDNDQDQLTDEECPTPCGTEDALGRCDGNVLVACETGTILRQECGADTPCGMDDRGFASCQGCGNIGMECNGKDILYCSGTGLATYSCPEACAVDGNGGHCICTSATSVARCISPDTLSYCSDGVTIDVTCPHGCGTDPAGSGDMCLCTEVLDSRCQGNDAVWCNGVSGEVERFPCPYGCVEGMCLCQGGVLPGTSCQGDKLVECDGQAAVAREKVCPYGCANNECLCEGGISSIPTCSGKDVVSCDQSLEIVVERTCSLACVDGQCVCEGGIPQGYQCQDNNLVYCDPSAGLSVIRQCVHGCQDGDCVCNGGMHPGSSCQDGLLKTCDYYSLEYSETQCPFGCAEDSFGGARCACDPRVADGSHCNANQLLECDAKTGAMLTRSCRNGCEENMAGRAFCRCSTDGNADTACVDNTLLYCDEDTNQEQERQCQWGCAKPEYMSESTCLCPGGSTYSAVCAGQTELICSNGMMYQYTCSTGCDYGLTGFAECNCTDSTVKGSCQGNRVTFCEFGSTKSIECPEGCTVDEDGYARCKGQCGLTPDMEAVQCEMDNLLLRCARDNAYLTGYSCAMQLKVCAMVDGRSQCIEMGVDGGSPDGGSWPGDAGSSVLDSGVMVVDAGENHPDAAVQGEDAGMHVVDSGVLIVDAGHITPADSGSPVVDAGLAEQDAGTSKPDAGQVVVPDAGQVVVTDAGTTTPDAASTIDAGTTVADASLTERDSGIAIPDSGESMDAATPSTPDASVNDRGILEPAPDAATTASSGEAPRKKDTEGNRCDCSTTDAPAPAAWLMMAVLGLMMTRRERR